MKQATEQNETIVVIGPVYPYRGGIVHVYVGERQGRVNYNREHVLHPEQLLASSHYRPLYHQDRVWIFELVK